MKNKLIILALIISFTISLCCGIIGYVKNKEEKEKPPVDPPIVKNEITYQYYLEDVLVNEMPKNKTTIDENGKENKEILYLFKKFSCTNDVNGDFNNDTWEFVSDENKESVCKLYFVKSKYEVSFTVTNGVVDENNFKEVERENDGNFKIIPNEGYKFKEAICSNDKKASWNQTSNTISLSAITYDVACTVKFERKNLKIEVIVTNGLGNTTENVFYGDSKSIVVEPKDGFNKPTVVCTNGQEAVYENNNITFEKVTNDTVCKVKFKAIIIPTYLISISNPTENENISIISGNDKFSISSGKDGKIILKSTDGSTPTLSCGDTIPVTNTLEELELAKTVEFTFYNVTKNITCKIGSN